MGFPELMQLRGVDEEVKIHVDGKETLWNSEHRECNPPADQLELVPENQAQLCFTDALGRKTYLRTDVVSDVSSLNSTTEAYFNQYQGLRELIKVLFIDIFPSTTLLTQKPTSWSTRTTIEFRRTSARRLGWNSRRSR